jgi:hypothetical protein
MAAVRSDRPLLPLAECARALRISVSQLRHDVEHGCPQARQGRRGHGGRALFDPVVVAAWRARRAGVADDAALLRLIAAELPEIFAAAIDAQFNNIEGPHKRAMGRELARSWFLVTTAALDRLRKDAPAIPELAEIPVGISRLRGI